MMRIDYLANHQASIPMWADYFWTEWKTFYLAARKSPGDVRRGMAERCNTDRIPLAVVALEDERAIGTGCLKITDLDERPELTPCLAGIFVVPEARRRGVGSLIIRHLENAACVLGHKRLYLWTPQLERFYESLGWQFVEHAGHLGKNIVIMEKTLIAEPVAGDDPSARRTNPGGNFGPE